jgi:ParB-like chromosome segregation protein Spo0J
MAAPSLRKAVGSLVESIREIGLRTPLVVRPCQRYLNGVLAEAWEISAGAHRHEAAIRLGLDELFLVWWSMTTTSVPNSS